MARELRAASGGIACAMLIALSAAHTAAQNPPQSQSAPARNFVAIGCLSREGPAQGQGAQATYIITDTRANPPLRYRLDASADQLSWHVGHTLEVVAGPVTLAPRGRGGNSTAALPTLKVQSLAYISPTCIKYQ